MATLTPNSGPAAGGNSVVITGNNFNGATSVKFGNKSATFTVDSNTQITATAPSGNGVVGVSVITPGGTTTPVNYFYVPQPIKTSLSNTSGPLTGATTTISGANLGSSPSVTFGTLGTGTVTGSTSSSINVTAPTAPAGTGTVPITVTTSGGSTNGLFFTFVDPPTSTAIDVTSGPESGGTASTITGTGFSDTTGVTYGTTSAGYLVLDDSHIVTYSPGGTGTVDINVITPGGPDPTPPSFTYTPPPA